MGIYHSPEKNIKKVRNPIINAVPKSGWIATSPKIITIGNLVSKSRYQLLSIRNLGNKSLDEIIDVLGKYNLKLKGE